ncbi:hypothetical protein Tco_1554962 [Tanacetum coccineum]
MYKVRHERVQTDPNLVERSNRLFGENWDKLVVDLRVAEYRSMVFTNMGNNILLLALFRNNGTCMHDGIVFPSMLMLPARTIPSYAINDKRAEHFCSWECRIGHYTEDDVLYTILNAPVYDKYMLTVLVEYSFAHELDKYKKAVLVHDDVRAFSTMCDFELPKMLRFKLVEKVKEDVEGVNMEMPLFHDHGYYCVRQLTIMPEGSLSVTFISPIIFGGQEVIIATAFSSFPFLRIDATAED